MFSSYQLSRRRLKLQTLQIFVLPKFQTLCITVQYEVRYTPNDGSKREMTVQCGRTLEVSWHKIKNRHQDLAPTSILSEPRTLHQIKANYDFAIPDSLNIKALIAF